MPDLSTITPVTREEEFLDRIARAAASPNLPEVDASDNGDVLTVVDGEWAAAAPAGGAAIVLYLALTAPAVPDIPLPDTYVWQADAGNTYVSLSANGDPLTYEEFSEIVDSYESGAIVLVATPNSGDFPGSGAYVYTSISGGYKYESIEDKQLFSAVTAMGSTIAYMYTGIVPV